MDPAALDRLWNAMNRQVGPVGGRSAGASLEAAETIRTLDARDDAPHLTGSQFEAIWATVAAATLPAAATAPPLEAGRANGRLGFVARLLALIQLIIRQAAIGSIAGILVGAVVIGGGARVLMRIAALLSRPELTGAMTENGNRVGDVTLDGTLALLIFTGMAFGWLGGIVVMAVRPWLPAEGWQRLLLAGAIGFAVAGPMVLQGENRADYERFGILGVNICLFMLLPVAFGMAVIPVIDALDRRIPQALPSLRLGAKAAIASILMVLVALPLVTLVVSAFEGRPVGLLLLLPVVRYLTPLWARHAPTFGERQKRETRGTRIGYLALAVSCFLGLLLTAQSIAALMN